MPDSKKPSSESQDKTVNKESSSVEREEGISSGQQLDLAKILPVISKALEEENWTFIQQELLSFHPADIADLIEHLPSEERLALFNGMVKTLPAEVYSYLEEDVREKLLEGHDPSLLAEVLEALDSDDAVEILEDLEEEEKQRLFEEVSHAQRALYEEALTYPEGTAGRMMQREVVLVPLSWTVGAVLEYLNSSAQNLPDDFYEVYVIDGKNTLVGVISLSHLMRHKREQDVQSIMSEPVHTLPLLMPEEEIAYYFRQYGLVSAAVVKDKRVRGVITLDDVVGLIDHETEDDLFKLGGVGQSDVRSNWRQTFRARSPWLLVNLGTALAASLVISLFESVIGRFVLLSALMTIVASMGGNGGTQTLTVSVRALALKDLTPANHLRFVMKEALVGLLNGVLFGALAAALTILLFKGSFLMALVIAFAMIATMIVAAISGALIPLFLNRMNIDPANASGVILTTLTDVVGFFSFLGLAYLFLS